MLTSKSSNVHGFARQPTLVKVAVGVTLYLAFVHVEELILDRYGLYRFLPFYRFAKFCPWDIAALGLITWFLGSGLRRRFRPKIGEGPCTPVSVKLAVGLMYLDALALLVGFLDRYGVLARVPAAAIRAPLVAIVGATAWWVVKRPSGSSFASQPVLVKIAAALAVANTLLFLAY